jgi:uncharacterized metal-binding protein YceD (DUF177 family)
MSAPLSQFYNLARLGNAGDAVDIEADESQRAAIAALAGALALPRFFARVDLKKTSSSRFLLSYRLEAEVVQACVVTLEPVAARIDHAFIRELHFTGTGRHLPEATDLDLSGQDLSLEEGDEPEEIDNLHYDLAGPVLEEFLLALDPYPRCPGVEFDPGPEAALRPESPFAALKSLKPSK